MGKLDDDATTEYSTKLGAAAALMIVLGYPGEISGSLVVRMVFWVLAMIPFLYIIFVLFVGLSSAVDKQPEEARSLVSKARYVTIISWLTYPVVYILPLFGLEGTSAMVGIQIGYSMSDFISKCILGLMVTKIALAKSEVEYNMITAHSTSEQEEARDQMAELMKKVAALEERN